MIGKILMFVVVFLFILVAFSDSIFMPFTKKGADGEPEQWGWKDILKLMFFTGVVGWVMYLLFQ